MPRCAWIDWQPAVSARDVACRMACDCFGATSLVGAPCGVWDVAFGIRGVRVLMSIGGCVERDASYCCEEFASAKRWASWSALRVVGATAVRGGLLGEARQLVRCATGVGRAAVFNRD